MVRVCLGTDKTRMSVSRTPPGINNASGARCNPIPFNILLQIQLVLFRPARAELSLVGSTGPGVCWCRVEGQAQPDTGAGIILTQLQEESKGYA